MNKYYEIYDSSQVGKSWYLTKHTKNLLRKEFDLEKGLVMDSITWIVYTNCWLFVVVETTFCIKNSSLH